MSVTTTTRNSKLIRHNLPCPSCPSSDAYAEYDDGHGYCFSCQKYFPSDKQEPFITNQYTYEYFPHRGISKEAFEKYDVRTKIDLDGKPLTVGFKYPNGAYKLRNYDDKTIWWSKEYPEATAGLYGTSVFSAGEHKYVTVVEGEYDALALWQVLKSPVVSVQSAATAGRDCAASRSFLNSFERVYLALDGDARGREATAAIARTLDYNKVYDVKFTKYKDANDYVLHGEEKELLNIWWNAGRYQPDAVISSFQEYEQVLKEPPKPGIPYPFHALNEMTYGIRTGESVLITAQEGVGKTELMHSLEYQILKETDYNVGAIFLEEPKRRHLQAVAGLELRKPAHLPDSGVDPDTAFSALQKAVGRDRRLFVYSHFGSDDPESLLDTIRFLVGAMDCRVILFDHISMAVSGLAGEDERRALDYLSTRLEMMVKELDFALIMVSHVNDEGKTRGSRYISKIADIRIDATRDTTASDPVLRNTTRLVVSKNRYSGKTGVACDLLFDPSTYLFEEIANDFWQPPRLQSPSIVPTSDAHTGVEGLVPSG